MNKKQATIISDTAPTSSDNIAAGYNIGQWWQVGEIGNKYYHKRDGVWDLVSNVLLSNVRIPLPEVFSFTITVGDGDTITIPHSPDPSFTHDYDINYGDGTSVLHVSSYNDANATHQYTTAGTYQIKINGICETFSIKYDNTHIHSKIISIDSWGTTGGFKILGFNDCINLLTLPSESGKLINVINFRNMFVNCLSLTLIPDNLFANNTGVTDFTNIFASCKSLVSIPEKLFVSNLAVTNFGYAFYNCTSLTSIPENLFVNNINVTNFIYTFSDCTALTGNAPNLWETHSGADGTKCFYNDTNLTNYNDIPDSWKL